MGLLRVIEMQVAPPGALQVGTQELEFIRLAADGDLYGAGGLYAARKDGAVLSAALGDYYVKAVLVCRDKQRPGLDEAEAVGMLYCAEICPD